MLNSWNKDKDPNSTDMSVTTIKGLMLRKNLAPLFQQSKGGKNKMTEYELTQDVQVHRKYTG